METQQFILFILALRMSLLRLLNTLGLHANFPVILLIFNQILCFP